MTEVKPWEPVSGSYSGFVDWPWKEGERLVELGDHPLRTCRVTLANSQRVIVRALSEERKAARLLQRKIDARVSARMDAILGEGEGE